jgi:hypothetical protein
MICMLTFLFLLFLPGLSSAQSGLALDSGDMAFYNFGGVSGSSIEMGNMEFYSFSKDGPRHDKVSAIWVSTLPFPLASADQS